MKEDRNRKLINLFRKTSEKNASQRHILGGPVTK